MVAALPETKERKEIKQDTAKQDVTMMLSQLPPDIRDKQAGVLLDLAFNYTYAQSGHRNGYSASMVRNIKVKYKEYLLQIIERKEIVLRDWAEHNCYTFLRLIADALQKVKTTNKASDLGNLANSLSIMNRIRLDLKESAGNSNIPTDHRQGHLAEQSLAMLQKDVDSKKVNDTSTKDKAT